MRLLSRMVAVSALSVSMLVASTFVIGPDERDDLPSLASRVKVGAYVHLEGRPYRDPVEPADLRHLESLLGRRFDIVHYYWSWGRPFDEAVTSNVEGRDLMLSWKPTAESIAGITQGSFDAYIDRFAVEAARYARPVYLRFGYEMNGEWMSYSAGRQGGPDADDFVRSWRHLVQRFRQRGATNVVFIWCPNERDFPNRDGNHMEDYWPGEQWVDVAGFDAYDWGDQVPVRGDGRSRSFEEIVEGPYFRISRFTSRAIWLCEFGTTGAAAGEWFKDMFAATRFKRLEAIIYFSENDVRDVQRDWRIDATRAGIRGWREGWVAPHQPDAAGSRKARGDPPPQ